MISLADIQDGLVSMHLAVEALLCGQRLSSLSHEALVGDDQFEFLATDKTVEHVAVFFDSFLIDIALCAD